jgi:hypothetical protein
VLVLFGLHHAAALLIHLFHTAKVILVQKGIIMAYRTFTFRRRHKRSMQHFRMAYFIEDIVYIPVAKSHIAICHDCSLLYLTFGSVSG